MPDVLAPDKKDLKGLKVALVVPGPFESSLYGDWDLSLVDSVSPPLGLLSLAAVVRSRNGTASLHDAYARRLGVEETVRDVVRAKPDIVGITCMSHSYPVAKRLIAAFKEAVPDMKIMMGGVHISAVGRQVMDDIPGLDYGVMREGELTVIDLLDAIRTHGDFGAVKGILFRSKGELVQTLPREFIRDLDMLPFPAWDLLGGFPGTYRLSIIGTKGSRSTSLITSRGCPGKCGFCDVGAVGGQIRSFSAGYVIRMIEHLKQEYGIDDFLIYDDNFVTLKERTRQICEEIIRRKWDIHWSCSARVDMVNPEMLALMKRAGCWQIEYGIESGSQKILDLMHKRITLDQIRAALKWTKAAGIETRGNFIFGYLQESRQTLEESLRFSLDLDLDYFQQTFLTPYPGSRIYHEADSYGFFDRSPEKMNNLTINFVPRGLTEEELKTYSRRAFRQFYFRPRVIMHHISKVKKPQDIARLAMAFWSFLKTIRKKRAPLTVSVREVKNFWEQHPLLSYELGYVPGTPEFFRAYDAIREKDEFKYCFHLLRLALLPKGAKVLDVGCGNGWVLSRYAAAGAQAFGIDLTMKAVELSGLRFQRQELRGRFMNASAESLPFADNTFDMVTSLGVIHHTPRTGECAREIIRVCKPGGRVLIAVYYENLLLKKWLFPFTRAFLWMAGRRDLAGLSRQEFINHFDGPDNPLGKVYSTGGARMLVAGIEDVKTEVHYFPSRFVPALSGLAFGEALSRFLDRRLGFLIYVEGHKPCVES